MKSNELELQVNKKNVLFYLPAALRKSKATHHISLGVGLVFIASVTGGLVADEHKERIALLDQADCDNQND